MSKEINKENSQEKKSIIKDFYGDVDKVRKKRGSFCTCYSFAILVVIAIIVLSVFVVLGLKKISNPNTSIVKKVEPSQQALESIKSKFNNLINVNNQNVGQTVSLTITQEELTSLMSQGDDASFPLKDINAEIDEAGIIVNGKYQKDLLIIKNVSFDLIVLLEPTIVNEKLKITVKEIEAGELKINKTISSRIGKSIENFVDQKINRENIAFESIVLSKGQMTLSGRQK